MAIVDLVMPKMGESIMEATILKWLKKEGESIELDESILEIATDKVDSDIPSPVEGVLAEILFSENEVVEVGKVIARIKTDASEVVKPSPAVAEDSTPEKAEPAKDEPAPSESSSNGVETTPKSKPIPHPVAVASSKSSYNPSVTERFYSPLVRTIAQQESISVQELDQIQGSGANGRVTKSDILSYVEAKKSGQAPEIISSTSPETKPAISSPIAPAKKEAATKPTGSQPYTAAPGTEIIEMDRMRKLIAEHMVMSKHTSPHVTSFVEVDVTEIVEWRNRIKGDFQKKYGEKITFTPIFIEAVTRALKDFPMVNVSLEGDKIIKKNFVNIGMAAALPTGNLIVPVIKDADHMNLLGLTKAVNDLASRARENKLKAEEIQGGTFTVTNVGTFGNVMGTPIINQPQVAILAVGAIRKKPAVVETDAGDLIAVRHMMFLSLSYDHRVVDGFLGGSFLRKIGDYLEAFDKTRNI